LPFPKLIQISDLVTALAFLAGYMAESASSWASSCQESICGTASVLGIQRVIRVNVFDLGGKIRIFFLVVYFPSPL